MTTTVSELGLSPALGLWAKHCFVMDELYEIVDPLEQGTAPDSPEDIRKVLDEVGENVLADVFNSAEHDRNVLLDAAIAMVERHFLRMGRTVAVSRRNTRDAWTRRIHIASGTDAAPLPKGPIWATVSLVSDPGTGSLSQTVTLWSKGGQRAAQILRHLPSAIRDRSRTQELDFAADSVLISCLPLNCRHAADGISLDMDALLSALSDELSRNDPTAMASMMSGLRSLT